MWLSWLKRIPFITHIIPPPTDGIKNTLQCKNRPWDLLIHLHIVRKNIACFCKAVQVTKAQFIPSVKPRQSTKEKNIIYFQKPIQYIIGKVPQCVLRLLENWHHSLHHIHLGGNLNMLNLANLWLRIFQHIKPNTNSYFIVKEPDKAELIWEISFNFDGNEISSSC